MPKQISEVMKPVTISQQSLGDDIVDLRSLPQFRQIRNNAFLDDLRRAVAFDYVSVIGLDLNEYRLGDRNFVIASDLPAALVETYLAGRLYETDPLLHHVLETQCFGLESDVYSKREVPRRFAELADLFFVKNRTVFPIKRNAVVVASVCFMRRKAFTEPEISFLLQIAAAVYAVVAEPLVKRFAAESAKLTESEITCLKLASQGLTTAEIADNSRFQAVTVDSYIKIATRKLGCHNRTHAVAEAIRRQII